MGCKFEFRLDQSIHWYSIFKNTKKKQLKLVINWMGCKFEFGLDQPIHWYLILKIPKIPNNQKKTVEIGNQLNGMQIWIWIGPTNSLIFNF